MWFEYLLDMVVQFRRMQGRIQDFLLDGTPTNKLMGPKNPQNCLKLKKKGHWGGGALEGPY